MTTVRDIDEALKCGRTGCPCSRGRNRHCPVAAAHSHGDGTPSLTIKVQGDRILFNCKTGCDQEDVIAALKDRELWPPVQDSAPRNQPYRRKPSHFVKEWAYLGPDGPLAYHGRFEYDDGTGKEFLWRRPDQQWGDRGVGLGDLSISELPLYNLDLLLAEPDEPVYVCEGEKAADICVDHGLIAVALGGGAAQKDFGSSLEPLAGRTVILWPDNDEPGAALMGRIAAILPRAKFLNPPGMPPKGDADDFFRAGRTIAELRALTKDPEPTVRITDDAMVVEIPVPSGVILFTFTDAASTGMAVDAYLSVEPRCSAIPTTEPYEGHIVVRSLTSREAFRRQLDLMYGKDHQWTQLLNRACRLFGQSYTNQVAAVDITEIALSYDQMYRIAGVVPEGQLTTLFGLGGGGKTQTSLSMAACLLLGIPWLGHEVIPAKGIIFVDYEADGTTVRRRLQRILDGLGESIPAGRFHYFYAGGVPYPLLANRVKREAQRVGADVIIVDSAAAACGGEPEKADAALGMLNAVKRIGLTTILIAHVRKPEVGSEKSIQWKMMPFGSAFWHNNTRASWYIEGQQNEGDSETHVAAYNRKMNDDQGQRTIYYNIHFYERSGPIHVTAEDMDPYFRPKASPVDQLYRVMTMATAGGPQPITEIWAMATSLDVTMSESTIRTILNENEVGHGRNLFVKRADGHRHLWSLAAHQTDGDAPRQSEWESPE